MILCICIKSQSDAMSIELPNYAFACICRNLDCVFSNIAYSNVFLGSGMVCILLQEPITFETTLRFAISSKVSN